MKMAIASPTIGYYSVLGFSQEPFSNTPDPCFFFHSRQHAAAFTNLLIELRLRRGLSVIFGDVGTGKTTLSRKLIFELSRRGDMIVHMILDPSFNTEGQFLSSLVRNFNITWPKHFDPCYGDIAQLRDAIEQFLLQKTIEETRTVILIIDEAQKLNLTTLETLRVLLNFETNNAKLIQLVLLGQLELYSKVIHMENFMDRISFKYTLNPLDAKETKEFIQYRLVKAGYNGTKDLFNDDAVSEIYNYTRGYPRKINMLCHKLLKELIIHNLTLMDGHFVRTIIEKEKNVFPSTISKDN